MHETEIHSNTIEKLKRGSYEAFDTLYDMYADSLYGFALLHTKSSVQAEDIVQDTFLKLWNMRASLSVEGSFKFMLFTIAKNHVIDVFRQQINRPDFEDYIRFCEDEHLLDNTSVEKIYFSATFPVEKSENYDLMSVVTICLGDPGTENYTGIVKFMDVLLSSSRAATEKKKILEEEFGVAMNEELEREVLVMCNLSQGVKAEGINIGEMRMLVQLVRDGDLKIERAAEKAKMTVEQFKKVMENTPLQAV